VVSLESQGNPWVLPAQTAWPVCPSEVAPLGLLRPGCNKEAKEYLYLTKNNFKDNQYILITNLKNEPKSFIEAISSPNKKHWIRAMQEEYKELTSSNT